MISPKCQRRLVAVEKALRERAQRARPFPDYEHLDGLLRVQSMPEWFPMRVRQVIERIEDRIRAMKPNSGRLEPSANDLAHSELPLGLPDWFR
jgi:hypothetical protein